MLKSFVGSTSKSAESEMEFDVDNEALFHFQKENEDLTSEQVEYEKNSEDYQMNVEQKKRSTSEKDQFKKIIKSIENLSAAMDSEFQITRRLINEVLSRIEQIENSNSADQVIRNSTIPVRTILIENPLIDTDEELSAINELLNNNDSKTQLQNELNFVGGQELQKYVSAIVTRLLSKNILKSYSVVGGKN